MIFWFATAETLAIATLVIALMWYYVHNKWQFFKKMNIPHDPPRVLKLGHLIGAMAGDAFYRHVEMKKKYGAIYGLYSGIEPMIVCHDTDIMRQIYIKDFQNFTDRMKVLQRLNGKEMNNGILAASGKKWKRLRTTLTPTFSMAKMKQMFLVTRECTDETIEVLRRKHEKENGEFVARELFSNLSLDVIVSTALGTKVNTQSLRKRDSRLVKEVRKLFVTGFAGLTALVCFTFPPAERIFEKLNINIFPNDSLAYIRDFTNAVIEKRLQDTSERRHNDLLQLMLDAEVPEDKITENSTKGMTRTELIGNAVLMIGAGFENTGNSMTFLAYNLAFHLDVQNKLQKEIDEAYSEKGGFEYEAVKNLKYLDMCLNESLRLYNPILVNSRVCRKETTINGLTIPEGVTVQFPVFGLSHDPDYWDEPWEFRPERMEDMSQIDPMMFQPFGAGPRNCIGLRFAEMEIKMAFFAILHNFSIRPCETTPKPPLELTFKLGVRPAEEFKLKVVQRAQTK